MAETESAVFGKAKDYVDSVFPAVEKSCVNGVWTEVPVPSSSMRGFNISTLREKIAEAFWKGYNTCYEERVRNGTPEVSK